MFKSKYYLPAEIAARSYQSEEKIEEISYDKDYEVYDDAIILPLKKIPDSSGHYVNVGGVCDEKFNFIAGNLSIENGGGKGFLEFSYSYKAKEIEVSDESVIFSGFMVNHFGHFLTDSMSRMWYATKNHGLQVAIIVYNPDAFADDWNFDESFQLKLLELMGIKKDRILFIDKPTKFKSVLIPKQSVFWAGYQYNDALLRIVYDKAKQNIIPNETKKIYLSRSAWKSPLLNEAYFEDFFASRGFKIIHPQNLPLEEQIAYIAGADEIACTYGTLSHLALFAKQRTKLICILRYSQFISPRQQKIDVLKELDVVYIDTSFNFLPTRHFVTKPLLIAPTCYWIDFLKHEYGITEFTDIFEFLNQSKIDFGDYFKLYLQSLTSKSFLQTVYAFKFNPYEYLKSLFNALNPEGSGKMFQAAKITDNPLFRGRLFTYIRSDTPQKYIVKLLGSGRIWPVNQNSLKGEASWSYINGRLYFINGANQTVSEFVTEGIIPKKGYARYIGVLQQNVTVKCTLETYHPGGLRNWLIKHIIKLLVNKKRYKKLKQSPVKFFEDSKNTLIRYLGKNYISSNSTVIFFWREQFQKYFSANDMKLKVAELKAGMDDISKTYIDYFMKLSKCWYKSTFIGSQRPEHELLKLKAYKEFKETFEQPFPDIMKINPYYFFDIYGLADLPDEALALIDGKLIIDGGGLNGDTALTFHHHFPNSEIHVYEPLGHYVGIINKFLEEDNCNYKIKPVNKGLGEEIDKQFMRFGAGANMAEITTLDSEYTDAATKIGLIKLDVEGMETQIINGAKAVIARDKPVLAIAIYHRPEDFFELKNKIKALNPAYRFMIRKSEPSLPQADLVLIAY